MPKSKRNHAGKNCCFQIIIVVSLTQTKSKGKEHKDDVVNNIRESIDNYKSIYVLEFDNMRTNAFKDLRAQLSDSRYRVSSIYPIK